jgi:hypothetical protein
MRRRSRKTREFQKEILGASPQQDVGSVAKNQHTRIPLLGLIRRPSGSASLLTTRVTL